MSELKISKKQEQEKLTVFIGGRIDTGTSARLGDEVRESLDGITDLGLDFGEVSYISSSGLRVILSLHKTMAAKSGRLTV
ncbi:MAG: STAS domain-containing protein [Ruminiclostridium sp.]|nr:STAS domain-containing protein [Ruminiclostridium sp.]